MRTEARIWVDYLIAQKFEVPGAIGNSTIFAKQLAGAEVRSNEVGSLFTDLKARESELRAVEGNLRALEMADILQRAADDMRGRTWVNDVLPADDRPVRYVPPLEA